MLMSSGARARWGAYGFTSAAGSRWAQGEGASAVQVGGAGWQAACAPTAAVPARGRQRVCSGSMHENEAGLRAQKGAEGPAQKEPAQDPWQLPQASSPHCVQPSSGWTRSTAGPVAAAYGLPPLPHTKAEPKTRDQVERKPKRGIRPGGRRRAPVASILNWYTPR